MHGDDKKLTRLIIGSKAPEFSEVDIHGENHTLKKYHGRKWMFSFFRYASCPMCNFRVHQLIQEYEKLKKLDFRIIAVFESSKESIQQYVGKQDVPFPIIPNPELSLYRSFGVESSWSKYMLAAFPFIKALAHGFLPGKMEGDKAIVPADFLINPNGTIHTAYYGKNIGDHLLISNIRSFIKG